MTRSKLSSQHQVAGREVEGDGRPLRTLEKGRQVTVSTSAFRSQCPLCSPGQFWTNHAAEAVDRVASLLPYLPCGPKDTGPWGVLRCRAVKGRQRSQLLGLDIGARAKEWQPGSQSRGCSFLLPENHEEAQTLSRSCRTSEHGM